MDTMPANEPTMLRDNDVDIANKGMCPQASCDSHAGTTLESITSCSQAHSSLAAWSVRSGGDEMLLPVLMSRLIWQREVPLPLENLQLLPEHGRHMVLGQRLYVLAEVLVTD